MNQNLSTLKELLLKDRAALLDGQLSELGTHATLMQIEIDRLESDGLIALPETEKQLSEIRNIAGRNAELLNAAVEGARSARENIDAIKRAAAELNTYNEDGDIKNVNEAKPKHEKRA